MIGEHSVQNDDHYIIIIYLIFVLIIKYKNDILLVTKKQRPKPEKPINQENFFTELRDQLNEFHIESGRSILEGGELNSISAMLPLPSATLPLPLFKILPLPSTSRAALDRPAKINKPIVK